MKKQIVSAINCYILKNMKSINVLVYLWGVNVLYNDFLFYRIAKK